jgi:hypothetical protein
MISLNLDLAIFCLTNGDVGNSLLPYQQSLVKGIFLSSSWAKIEHFWWSALTGLT